MFYGAWDWRFLSLIALSTVVDWWVGQGLVTTDEPGRRRRLVWTSVAVNLGLLGTFKYFDFFVGELQQLCTAIGLPVDLPVLGWILPVGISFYTFQTLSFSIDVYRGQTRPPERFEDFALYVSFFPQLVAGPIERSSRLLPQITQPRRVTAEDFRWGLHEIVLGLFKKVAIADQAAPLVNHIFATPVDQLSGPEVLVGVYAFALQIYGDFSGYSSIAIGVARWLGFDLMTNFRVPYFATSPQDFWRRWHISLSTWLRDYLYIPLGGSRGSTVATYRNLLATMVLGGIWHGAAWTFVWWGVLHGGWLALHRMVSDPKADPPKGLARWLRIAGTFHVVCLGWLLFRAESMAQVWGMVGRLGDWRWTDVSVAGLAWVVWLAIPLCVYEYWTHGGAREAQRVPEPWWLRGLIYGACGLAIAFSPAPVRHAFIYFQF